MIFLDILESKEVQFSELIPVLVSLVNFNLHHPRKCHKSVAAAILYSSYISKLYNHFSFVSYFALYSLVSVFTRCVPDKMRDWTA